MVPRTTSAPLDEVAFLARSGHRVTALAALAERPQSRGDLQEVTGASRSTIGRTLRAFEDRHWVSKNGNLYEATELGAFVVKGLQKLIERIETEQQFRDTWQWLPSEASGFTVEMATNAVVTVAETDSPYRPVNRFTALLRETSRFQFIGIDVALLEPCKDELQQQIVDGMQADIVDPPSVAKYILSTYPDHCSAPLESGNLKVKVHDDLPPYGVGIFDDRIAISGYDQESGMVRVLVDTDSSDAREWALSTFETYRREARPLARELAVE